MAMITNDWLTALGGEFHKPYYRQLFEFVKNEYNTTVVFPPADDIFNAFHLTPLSKVKVVILGQDPYHNVGQAHGLCFSVKPDVEIPPSLVNIYQELHDDLGCYIPNNGYLVKWAEQGVLMLNTVLTVRAHMANSHHGKGWEEFTDAAIRALNAQDRPIVFILWGRPAQMKKAMLNNPNHLILEALIFNTFRENVITVRQTSPEGCSIRCGRSAFFIISVHHRHFCCSHFYCFGANRIKIAKSVQKNL